MTIAIHPFGGFCKFCCYLSTFSGYIGRQFAKLRLETAGKTDVRLRVMNEIIHGIKVIKMYAWEYSFANLVSDARM